MFYELCGERAHTNPEWAYVKAVTSDRNELIKKTIDFINYGPDDITHGGICYIDRDIDVQIMQKALNKETLSPRERVTLLRLANYDNYELDGAGIADELLEYDDEGEMITNTESHEFDEKVKEYATDFVNSYCNSVEGN
ncbi:MAG: hypothetical protein IK021_03415 [Methanobrevibacter sp.]|nr:hypothetical protein [Methanobrevibacter sp.]